MTESDLDEVKTIDIDVSIIAISSNLIALDDGLMSPNIVLLSSIFFPVGTYSKFSRQSHIKKIV